MESFELNLICRLCVKLLESENVTPIFNNNFYSDKISLPDRIKYCSSVEVKEGDGLPPQICNSCLSKLNQSFTFHNQCVLADLTLKRIKDATFKISEIPNLLTVDIDNQIINSDIDVDKYFSVQEEPKELENNFVIDEFDNSKNGRHKKNVTVKIKSENNESESEIESKEEKFGKESKRKKKSEKEQEKKEDLKIKTEVENFTIEPDILSFKEDKSDLGLSENSKKSIKKVAKPKSLGLKKKKSRKLVTKEKPTSYTCDYCKKVYPSEGGWRYHIHTMHNENYQPFICDLCGQSFKVKKNLEGHKNSIHFHLKLHLCDLCGRGFASKYALKVHKIWHNDEKNFTCDVCGTKFRTRGKMNTHKSIHGGPKKFMCHICSRDFRWKKDFEIHMRTHTGEKPFKCSHCGKAFASLTNMKKHERNHVEKLALVKDSEELDVMAEVVDERLYRNEFLDFGFGSEDIRNREVDPV